MVIIVGTSHSVQAMDSAFQTFLEPLCRQFDVQGVAEEMSAEALAEKGCALSMPMAVARALRVPHQFCDPDRAQRATLGIRQENDIRVDGFLSGLSETELVARIADSNARRECYWLHRLKQFNLWPILFVCGASHVTSFSKLLKDERVVVRIAVEDWASNSAVGSGLDSAQTNSGD